MGKKAKRVVFLGIDGADPIMMQRFIDEGYLPNIKKFVDNGAAETDMSMLGVQPTITPPNWATLATGAYPGTHGITCFWNHELGNELTHLDNGFNSELCKAEYIWDSAAKDGIKSIVFNYPTGWPATNENVIAVDGSAVVQNTKAYIEGEGFYYADIQNASIESSFREKNNTGDDCLIEDDIKSADFKIKEEEKVQIKISGDKKLNPEAYKKSKTDTFNIPIKEVEEFNEYYQNVKYAPIVVNHAIQRRHGILIQNDQGIYDELLIFKSKHDKEPIGRVKVGDYSDWIYDTFNYNGEEVHVVYKVKLVEMQEDGSKFELYRNNVLNLDEDKYFYPSEIGKELFNAVGPMMHVGGGENLDIMHETWAEYYKWNADALLYLAETKEWNIMYMHCHALDKGNHKFQNKILEEHSKDQADFYLYKALLPFYLITDEFVRRMMALDDGNTAFFLVSDHGGMSRDATCNIPLIGDPWSIGGKLMEDLGYLKVDRSGAEPKIVWEETTAIGQRSGYVYVNLKGRDPQGIVEPEDYDALVDKIANDLLDYKDENGRPIALVLKREDMEILGLYGSTVGDLYFTFNSRWTRTHGTQLTTCEYKGTSVKAFFAMYGAGIKKGAHLTRRIRAVDVVPTICELTGFRVPKNCEGGIIYQGLEEFDA